MTNPVDTSTSSAAVFANEKPTSNGNGRIVWPGGPAKKQNFCLPDNIIYYMATNPATPKVYVKLAMSCKYFFEKKSLLIVARTDGNKFCSNQDCSKKYKCCVKIDLARITSKIWLTDRYFLNNTLPFNTLLPQKLYKSQNADLKCWWKRIKFENFKLVASSFQKFDFHCAKMVDNDGNVVMLEEVLGSLPNVKEFDYTFTFNAASGLTMKNISQLDNLSSLRILRLINISELFDVKDIEDFIMNHKDTKIWLHFLYGIPNAYKFQLDGLCDTVIKSEVLKCVIKYHGQDEKKFAVMHERYAK